MRPIHHARRLPPRLAFWALAGVALLISHDAIWLAQIGPGEALTSALRHGGHEYWAAASSTLTGIGVAAAAWAAIRLIRLRRVTAVARHEQTGLAARSYLHRAAGSWLRLLAVVAIGFLIQENVEHALMHGHAPGAGALLGPEYPLALPVIAAVTLLGALIAAAFVTAERILLARITSTHHTHRAPMRIQRPARRAVLPGGLDSRAHAGRGPPTLLAPV
jgi:hypothetical protein